MSSARKASDFLFAAVFACAVSTSVEASPAMQALDDAALSGIEGQAGIAVDIEYRINATDTGAPLATSANCRQTNLCNIGIQLNNRLNANGEWLVLKDAYASLLIKDLWIDGGFTQTGASPYADSSRFLDSTGTVCLPNTATATSACAGSVLDKPILVLSFGNSSYTTFEADIQLHLSIGRMAVQYDETGPSTDNGKSFGGVLISDTLQTRARMDIDGRVKLSGF